MATSKPTLNKKSKDKKRTVHPVTVRYYHPDPITGKNKDYFAPVGFSVDEKHWKNGKVVGTDFAPEANEKIAAVVARIEKAVRLASTGGNQPTADKVRYYYKQQPEVAGKVDRLFETWNEEGKTEIQQLQHEIELLLAEVAEKQDKIRAIQIQIGEYRKEKIVELVDEYITIRNKRKPKNANAKKSKKTFAANTQIQYEYLQSELTKYDSELLMKDIDSEKMYEFQNHLVKEGFYNGTIKVLMQKLGAILNHYKIEYDLSSDYKEYDFTLDLRDENVIYLTSEEIKAFSKVDCSHRDIRAVRKREQVRDLALIMLETGLRFSDATITKGDIKAGYIVRTQKKTGHTVKIPFTKRLQAICEKYDYKLNGKALDHWNNTFRDLLKSLTIDSLHEKLVVVNYCGEKRIEEEKEKWEFCSAHTLRRSMINQCLLKGLRYDQITALTGHKDFTTFQSYVDRATKEQELDTVFDYLDEPAMKVVA